MLKGVDNTVLDVVLSSVIEGDEINSDSGNILLEDKFNLLLEDNGLILLET
jgi:hypothetical protein